VLYPNVAVFNAKSIVGMKDPELQLACVRAYNDFLVDWSSVAPDRYVPVAALPFWDLALTLDEIERCAAIGHKGVIFTQDPSYFGLPMLTDRHWDPMWRSAEEKGLPVNFHIASGEVDLNGFGHPDNGPHANFAMMGISFFMGNAKTMSQLICGGICHRFPELNFVSVESGVGWIPFALEGLDWQWKNCGVPQEHPEYDLLPSEYFRRQIYGCFWFERDSSLAAIERLGPDNILYETDFPHPTSMSPGPASVAQRPDDYLRENFSALDETVLHKILHDNAARIYHLD
jgi:predicted TIM-barrel fold metal-dependent hydrolase